MLNFTVGPVQSPDYICAIGGQQIPYFRTAEFSKTVFESEQLIKKFAHASDDSRVIFITGSGTASMEASIINTLNKDDKALVINGGSFGQRFADLCDWHQVPHSVIKLDPGKPLTPAMLEEYSGKGYTAFIVNMHETSTGVLYDIDMISDFCKREGIFLIVDAISSFLTDPIYMEKQGIDILITGSQKALACAPGISVVVLSPNALNKVSENHSVSMYLDFKSALKDAERGQTPFTPAVGTILEIHKRLSVIDENGGVDSEILRVHNLAADFRNKIKKYTFPFELFSSSPSNAVTSLFVKDYSAYDIFLRLKDEYKIWICPNGGAMKDDVFRVGHIGDLKPEDNDVLINAFKDLFERNVL